MPELEINLGEVKYKPPLPVADYTFSIVKVSVEQAKEPNKRTGNREFYILCELRPLESEWQSYSVRHMWSLAPGALEIEDPVVSLKKLYDVMGVVVGAKLNTDDMLSFRFIGHSGVETYNGRLQPTLEKFIKPA